MKLNPIAVLFWIFCGLVAFAFGASLKVIAGVVAGAIAFSVFMDIITKKT